MRMSIRRSGVWILAGPKTESWTTQQDAVQMVVRQKRANFGAGDEWLYSNTGRLLLAETVEIASGKKLPAFAREQTAGRLNSGRDLNCAAGLMCGARISAGRVRDLEFGKDSARSGRD
jgi:hypothetical protein